jgi:hypothetical protein
LKFDFLFIWLWKEVSSFEEVGVVSTLGVDASGIFVCAVGVVGVGVFFCICLAICVLSFEWFTYSSCQSLLPVCKVLSSRGLKGGCTFSNNISAISSFELWVWLTVSCWVLVELSGFLFLLDDDVCPINLHTKQMIFSSEKNILNWVWL